MKLPLALGKLVYIITKPGIYHMLKGSTRVYVVLRVNSEVLVTKNWLGLHKTWRLPGGGAHKDENIIKAIQREVLEELGIEIEENKLQTIGTESFYEPTKQFNYYLFTLEYAQKPKLRVNQKEIVAAEWVDVAHLAALPLSEELNTALSKMK